VVDEWRSLTVTPILAALGVCDRPAALTQVLMAASQQEAQKHVENLAAGLSAEEIARRLGAKYYSSPPRVPGATQTDPVVVEKRWSLVPQASGTRDAVADDATLDQHVLFERNIENFIGTVKIPVGLAGPLRVNGLAAQGDFYIPLATTEAALVASYHRGAAIVTLAGGCTTLILNEGVGRSPAFAFASLVEAGTFAQWCLAHVEEFRTAADATSRHGRFRDLSVTVEGNHVYLLLEFTTGDAAGQNMVTIATAAVCEYIAASCPIKPAYSFVEGNMSGDKKASAQSFQGVRGKKVTAEVNLPRQIIERHLHTTPEMMSNYWRVSALGGVLSGTIGVQGHYANGLTALFIACGQDAACVSEAAVGVTRFEVTSDGGLYAAVTLPNLIVGTVGGGTGLPSQRACLEILGLAGPGNARAFAEVCAALVLAGELSIIGALSAGQFARAHARLARGKRRDPGKEESGSSQ
jgi:hydroxymethylglutaryl-CoA reductase (NADPH)